MMLVTSSVLQISCLSVESRLIPPLILNTHHKPCFSRGIYTYLGPWNEGVW